MNESQSCSYTSKCTSIMDNEKLIELVRECSFLYDLQDKRYSDTQKKDTASREIAQKLHTSDKECKKSWNALRNEFRRAIKRQKETKSGQECVPVKKWKFEDEMSFLQPYLKDRTAITSINCAEGETHDESSSNMERIPEDNPTVPIFLSQQSGTPVSNIPKSTAPLVRLPTRTKSRQFPKKPEPQETSSAVMMKYLLNQKQADDIDIFCPSMAATVTKFPPRQSAIAKARVFSVISKLEIELVTQPSEQPATTPTTSPGPSIYSYSSDSWSSQPYEEKQNSQININFPQEFNTAQEQALNAVQMSDTLKDYYNNF
ncbi:uncharacterized protein LOC111871887 [Cryptotermes secundus]|uniref:uncharacterized protein LOC111871887 n=1 Tax=Cryptotermes secundus TaxID=105785 RepID=UPI000CD7DE5C|nr:uncharacterized protein LOC111871887 [Cryptotermes secundus]